MSSEYIIIQDRRLELIHNPSDAAMTIEAARLLIPFLDSTRFKWQQFSLEGEKCYLTVEIPGISQSVLKSLRPATQWELDEWRISRGVIRLNMAESEEKRQKMLTKLRELRAWVERNRSGIKLIPHSDIKKYNGGKNMWDYFEEFDAGPWGLAARISCYEGRIGLIKCWFIDHGIEFEK